MLAAQTNGPGPVEDNETLWPKQIVDVEGETVMGVGGPTVTVPVPVTVVGVLAGSKPLTVTVYTVVLPGETVIVCVVIPPGAHKNVGLVKLVLADMVAVCPVHIVALVTGAIKPQFVAPVPPT